MLQLAWPEAALPRCAAGHGRSVLAAAGLAMSRHFGDRRPFQGHSAAWHIRAEGCSAQAVKPDVLRCAEIKEKHVSSTTVSTKRSMEPLGARRSSA